MPQHPWTEPPTWPSEDWNIHFRDNLNHLRHDLVPPGTILAYGGDGAPDGYLPCDGRVVPEGPEFERLHAILPAAAQGGRKPTPNLRGQALNYIIKY